MNVLLAETYAAQRQEKNHCDSNKDVADLPSSRLRLCKLTFWSIVADCFGPLTIKLGCCGE